MCGFVVLFAALLALLDVSGATAAFTRFLTLPFALAGADTGTRLRFCLSARGQLRLRRGVRDGGKRPLSCWGPPWAGGGCPSTASLQLPFTDSGLWDGDFSPSAFSTHYSAAC